MNRIKLTLPETWHFSINMTIRVTDLNYGGHVGNDSFLSLIQEARQQFLLSHGYEELSIGGAGLIMTDVAIEFKKELNYGDIVKISVTAADFDKLGFDLFYKMEVKNEDHWALAAKAKTGMLCYDYTQKKKMQLPEEVVKKLSDSAHNL